MENPATWGRAELTVKAALKSHDEAVAKGIVGLSVFRTITDALREEGLLVEEES